MQTSCSFFVNRGSFCIRIFFRNHNQTFLQKSNHQPAISKNSAHLRYDHLFPWNAFVLPACRFGTGGFPPVSGAPATNNSGSWWNARWGCFIAGMSFACLAPPHHAHHVGWLRKRVWSDGYIIFGWFFVRGVFAWSLRCGSSRQSVWPPGWLVLSLVQEIHKVMIFC